MKRIEIPKMSNEEVAKWYKSIKPIICLNKKDVYLENIPKENLNDKSYILFSSKEDHKNEVDFTKLSILAHVKIVYKYNSKYHFQPSVGDVISQIPKDLLERTIAFNLVYRPQTQKECDIFKEEYDRGYSVCVIRLFTAKNDTNKSISKYFVSIYPYGDDADIPAGMTQEEYARLLKRINN